MHDENNHVKSDEIKTISHKKTQKRNNYKKNHCVYNIIDLKLELI